MSCHSQNQICACRHLCGVSFSRSIENRRRHEYQVSWPIKLQRLSKLVEIVRIRSTRLVFQCVLGVLVVALLNGVVVVLMRRAMTYERSAHLKLQPCGGAGFGN